ncbi:glycosyltransferase [Zobellella denitrificans]
MKLINKNLFYRLIKSLNRLPNAAEYFDADWYYACYPDVEESGMDAWKHYYLYGRKEGRLPCCLVTAKLSESIWSKDSDDTIKALEGFLSDNNIAEKSFAAWSLGRWYASYNDWVRTEKAMRHYIHTKDPVPGHNAPWLLWIDTLIHNGKIKEAKKTISKLSQQNPNHPDYYLCECNMLNKEKNRDFLSPINAFYQNRNLATISINNVSASLFDSLSSHQPSESLDKNQPLVSIVVPTYNSESTIQTAINSLLCQTWRNLEIIIVDDASTDLTLDIAKKLSESDSRVKVVPQKSNAGAYATRNKGISLSSGEFITVHDSDDWSHPEKIHNQVLPLIKDSTVFATISHWVRASNDLVFGTWKSPAGWNGWVHRNTSSLMIKRSVFNTLGYWDRVNCNADVEYYFRIIKAFGADSIKEILPGTPLSFGRFHDNSLTQRAATNIFSVLCGMRKEYNDAFHKWHSDCDDITKLYLSETPNQRPFPAPKEMTR